MSEATADTQEKARLVHHFAIGGVGCASGGGNPRLLDTLT